ncbi:hypothetical protein COCOBI_10-0960 [Coccomyxa sp. Obi]|nr:hypothetical protein COCOBI_10-0960 [Coccomyxa sp. Obi]
MRLLPGVGTPIHAPSFAPAIAQAKSVAAAAPTIGRSYAASVVGQSGVCRIPFNGGTLISCASQLFLVVRDPADGFFDTIEGAITLAVSGATIIGGAIAAVAADPQHGIEGLPDAAAAEGQAIEMAGQVCNLHKGSRALLTASHTILLLKKKKACPTLKQGCADHLGAQIEGGGEAALQAAEPGAEAAAQGAEAVAASQPGAGGASAAEGAGAEAGAAAGGGEVGLGVDAGVTAGLEIGEADNVPLDLQDGDVATTDASIKAAQNKGISNPVQSAMQAGKKQNPSAQAPLTAFQSFDVLAPQQAKMAKAPSALPSAIQAGLATPVSPSSVASGGRKMLQSAPDCCNFYTVKPGDTLTSIAQAYGQPTNGAQIMQARTAVNSLSGDVVPGQTIMLPCGRLLTYIDAYNVGAITKAATINAVAG